VSNMPARAEVAQAANVTVRVYGYTGTLRANNQGTSVMPRRLFLLDLLELRRREPGPSTSPALYAHSVPLYPYTLAASSSLTLR